ncbi:aspartyl-tRNA synthetase-like protein [Plenodomus tracheiphilus IPT5]|uniref:Aspartyl-tRNA synthetase-like protein n=1 Tax=Plenodomus tracheiphilus IPT5 TaxID=1408161 RepID=A0A6A7BQ12_9PLEO|nr:aspartyl-tRNA synthetase-like protein [Plenodomus tracheiphilus IPT5]
MSLIHASRHVVSRGTCLRSSYAEISRFCRTRHHGITPIQAVVCSKGAVQCFSHSSSRRDGIEPDAQLKKSLDGFKASIQSSWPTVTASWSIKDLETIPLGTEFKVAGYVFARKDMTRSLSFAMLRNSNLKQCVQLVSSTSGKDAEATTAEAHECLRSLKEWTPVVITGKLKNRQPAKESTSQGMTLASTREVAVIHVEPMNELSQDLIIKHDTVFGPDRRHLQLRTDRELRNNISFRSEAMFKARQHLAHQQWEEIETPILFKSTPEGAREFLVPTRQKGLAYALPQSPQQYKQILMASGFRRYFQFARCFRDEDLRADRQPEFTQLDIEAAFAAEEDVMLVIEQLLGTLWSDLLGQTIPKEFPRMTYDEAMSSYGSDKPDLRYKAKIHDITQHLTQDLIGKITPLQDPIVEAFKIPISFNPKTTRKFVSAFLDSRDGKAFLDNPDGQPGIFIGDLSQPMQGLGPLGYQYVMEGPEALAVENGELLVLQARPNAALSGGSTTLGNLRLALYKAAIAQGLIEAPAADDLQFVWITNFPLFTPSNDSDPGQGGTAGFSSTHHPFTAPKKPADVDLLLTAPEKAKAAHYDIVLNGVELGGGSRRIHNATVQEFIFRDILKMQPERIEDFRHLLDVLRSGCPPHAGIALGWDRLMAVMLGKDSVRDVIAFPKSGKGEDLLVKSPNRVTRGQWDTYHLSVKGE